MSVACTIYYTFFVSFSQCFFLLCGQQTLSYNVIAHNTYNNIQWLWHNNFVAILATYIVHKFRIFCCLLFLSENKLFSALSFCSYFCCCCYCFRFVLFFVWHNFFFYFFLCCVAKLVRLLFNFVQKILCCTTIRVCVNVIYNI